MSAHFPGTPADRFAAAPAPPMLAVIEGAVMHRRTRPTANAFVYAAFCLRLPLSRLAELPDHGVALNGPGLLTFAERDHGPRDGSPLLPWIRALLATEHIEADGEVVLHSFPRMLGYVFNPVSFWVCHDRDGAVRAVLAEVNNTFGESHNYLVAHADSHPIAPGDTLAARKTFHVSPFCAVTGRYEFRFHFDPEHWLARIDYFDDTDSPGPLLATSISGRALALDRVAARSLIWRYAGFTLGVVARIHWQAVKLWVKRVPYFRKPAPPAPFTSRTIPSP